MKNFARILVSSILLSGVILLQSCNNFMDGGDFKEQLDKDIAYAKSSPYEIRIECDEGVGSITSLSLLSQKVTDQFNVEFKIASGVKFIGWKAYSKSSDGTYTELSDNYIDFITYNTESNDGIYKATVKFVKGIEGIVIKPYCFLLPKVSSITPEFTASGVDQDSIIKITFNKPVNPESFGDFSCVSIYSAESNLSEYFGTPYFSSDNTILYIPVTQKKEANGNEKHILAPDSGKKLDINVKIDFSETTDKDGLSITQNEPHTYRIKDSYGNQKKIKFIVKTVDGTGTFLSDGDKECTVGYPIDLQFTVNENYKFTGLEAVSASNNSSRSNAVSFKITDANTDLGIYKIRTIIAEGYDDILIRPVCALYPKVSKITPEFDNSGCDQDTTAKIQFNKAVNPATIDLSKIKIKSGGESLSSYYETPYFSDDKTSIIISPKKPTNILSEGTKDITISIDLTGAKDTDEMDIAQCQAHTFRINAHKDATKPVLDTSSLKLWIDSAKTKELTDKAFSTWNSTATTTFANGNFTQNHIRNSIYFEFTGTDEGSGISKAVIKETHYKKSDATDSVDGTIETGSAPVTENNGIYSGVYTLKSQLDGVIEVEISIEDYSENKSEESKTFYVIKDTGIAVTSIRFEENQEVPYYIYSSGQTYGTATSNYRKLNAICEKMGKNVTLTPLADTSSTDTFYSSYSTKFDYEIYWGYSENETINKATKSTSSGKTTFTFERAANRIVYLKIAFMDEVGNVKEIRRIIPATPNFDSADYDGGEINIIPYDYEQLDNLGSSTIRRYYLVENITTTQATKFLKYYVGSSYESCYLYTYTYVTHSEHDTIAGQSFRVREVNCLMYGDGSERSYWYSPASEKYFYISIPDSGSSGEITKTVSLPGVTTSTNTSEARNYINPSVNIKAEPVKSSGTCKVTVSGYEKNSSGVKYTLKCKYEATNEWGGTYAGCVATTDSVLSVTSPTKWCEIYVEAQNGTTLYAPASPLTINTVSGEGILKSSSTRFKLTEDVTPPNFLPASGSGQNYRTGYGIEIPIASDYNTNLDDAFLNSEGRVEINYYFIPNLSSDLEVYDQYTLEQLNSTYSMYKKTLSFDKTATSIIVPYYDIDESFYTLCLVAKDTSENYSVRCYPALNRTLGKDVGTYSFYSYYNGSQYRYWHLQFYNTNDQKIQKYDTDTKKWSGERSPYRDGYFEMGADNSSYKPAWVKIYGYFNGDTKTSGAYNTTYAYLDYDYMKTQNPKTCSSKNTIEGGVGMQVYCDASVFVHTVYSARKFTSTHRASDAKIWETKGVEASAMVHTPSGSESFTYAYDIYEDANVPYGVYYTTIAHFADGTISMGEIRQK